MSRTKGEARGSLLPLPLQFLAAWTLPPALANFEVPIADLAAWQSATRKGNVLRNWVTESLSVTPLQRRDAIADALKLAGITDFWCTIEPDKKKRQSFFDEFDALVLPSP